MYLPDFLLGSSQNTISPAKSASLGAYQWIGKVHLEKPHKMCSCSLLLDAGEDLEGGNLLGGYQEGVNLLGDTWKKASCWRTPERRDSAGEQLEGEL